MRNFVLLVMLLGTQFALADNNFAVGTCRPRLRSFTTIQAAVSGVPAGSTVLVCPGTYPEQVTITQPLSLQGIADSDLDEAVITIPSGGLTNIVPSIFSENVAAQVLVQSAGVVNITNITTDGTGGNSACVNWLAGIFYASGSSGTVARVRTRNEIDPGVNGPCGVGIWAENGGTTGTWIQVQGSSLHDSDSAGMVLGAGASSSLNVDLRDNFVSTTGTSSIDILASGVSGDITDNDLTSASIGIFDLSNGLTINANGISSIQVGVVLLGTATMQSNDIMNTADGVSLNAPGSSLQGNRITESSTAAVEFNCNAANVSHNVINDAVVGLSDVPASFNGNNTFANTGTVTTDGCGATAVMPMLKAAPLNAAPLWKGTPFLQWRTAVNPNGVKP
jgi:hypothetical protein